MHNIISKDAPQFSLLFRYLGPPLDDTCESTRGGLKDLIFGQLISN